MLSHVTDGLNTGAVPGSVVLSAGHENPSDERVHTICSLDTPIPYLSETDQIHEHEHEHEREKREDTLSVVSIEPNEVDDVCARHMFFVGDKQISAKHGPGTRPIRKRDGAAHLEERVDGDLIVRIDDEAIHLVSTEDLHVADHDRAVDLRIIHGALRENGERRAAKRESCTRCVAARAHWPRVRPHTATHKTKRKRKTCLPPLTVPTVLHGKTT